MGLWDKVKDAAERTANFVTGGMNDRKKGERITRWAKEQEEEAEQRLKDAQQATAESLAELGRLRVRVFETTVTEFVSLYEMMSTIQVSELRDTSQTFNVDPDLPEVKELKATSEHVKEMLLGGGAGALGGASLALGAWGLAGAIGSASTGTAIGTLSGVAATNATLAWLGGGAASAGGMGVAGGMAVLGGVALIPTAMVAMYFGQNNAKQKLNDARNYRDEVDAKEAQINTYVAQLEQILKGSDLMKETIAGLESVVKMQNSRMRSKLIDVAFAGHSLHEHLSTPLLAADGKIDEMAVARIERDTLVLIEEGSLA
jgi:hypothetical protein